MYKEDIGWFWALNLDEEENIQEGFGIHKEDVNWL